MKVGVPECRDWGSKQSSEPINNPNVWRHWVDCQTIPEKRGHKDLLDLMPKVEQLCLHFLNHCCEIMRPPNGECPSSPLLL